MKVTQVAVRPSEPSEKAGRPALTPELLAASGARYSRNNEGLDAILSRIDPRNLDKSVDAIFRMIDYGHQSIADMVPVAMFIDGISIWLAYYIWTLCPTAGGQESSTRYIKLAVDGLIPPGRLGIAAKDVPEWNALMGRCFEAYQTALSFWEAFGEKNPVAMGIPRALLEDSSDSARKKVSRMSRNFGFDRARYFLPVAAATNVMLIMSARGWVNLCQNLLSHPLPEPRELGELVRRELEMASPRMLKYARRTPSTEQGIKAEFGELIDIARRGMPTFLVGDAEDCEAPARAFLSFVPPERCSGGELAAALRFHENRYAWLGSALQRTAVRFGWSAVGFAEIRDLNRHRTGSKHCPQVPQGFYYAGDQAGVSGRIGLRDLARVGREASAKSHAILQAADPAYIFWSLLGTQFPFEHLTTGDKFIYEAELRTGTGAHFRYAKHLRDVLGLLYEHFPELKGTVLEGSAEPE
jgi:thymidylate synthase ThyX